MKKKKLLVFVSVLILLVSIAGYLLLVPFVEYREPDIPQLLSSRLTSPSSSFSFLVGKEGGLLSRFRKPSLVVYSPLLEVTETEVPSIQWGRKDSKATYSILLDKREMYASALREYEGKSIGFLYDENSDNGEELFQSLSLEFPDLVPVTYYERVSVVNKEEVVSALDELWGVIVFDWENSREACLETKVRIIMDNLSASSSVSLERVISIEPDWKEIIKSALKGEDISLDYTCTVLNNS